jgi:uncharacterized protein
MIYDASIPIFIHFLNGLAAILRKAEAHAQARKIDPEAFLKARLFPDMFTFTRQVQLACDFAKGAGARLAGMPVPSFPDEEQTFDDLHQRIRKTIEFLRSLKKDQFEDAATRSVTLRAAGQDLTFKGADYLSGFVLPNFYFHLTTAYGLLRHNGVELGKLDFMGRV